MYAIKVRDIHVGPFSREQFAQSWAKVNVPDGEGYLVVPLFDVLEGVNILEAR